MKYLKTYKQVNEGLRDKMTGVSEDDIRDKIQKNPNDMLRVIINYKSDELPSDLVNYIPIQKLTTPNKNILLKYASRLGNAKVVKELLGDSEVNPNTSNGMPIIFACKHGHIDIIKLLLDTGRVDPFDNLNIFLHSLDNLEVINLLLDWIEENGLEQKKLDHLLRKVIHNTRYNSISVRLLALGARFIVTELVRDDVINKPVDFLKLFVNVYNYDVEVIKKEKIDSNYYFTFSIKEKKLNEGLRDKMLPKSEEEILSQYNKLTTEKKFDLLKKIDLDRSLYPPKEEIEKYLSKYGDENRIRHIFELKLYDYLPVKDGYYYIDGNLDLDELEITKLPDNLHMK
ncbi:MAG: ankyrin repeat domain-containing protein, partial [bacterium]